MIHGWKSLIVQVNFAVNSEKPERILWLSLPVPPYAESSEWILACVKYQRLHGLGFSVRDMQLIELVYAENRRPGLLVLHDGIWLLDSRANIPMHLDMVLAAGCRIVRRQNLDYPAQWIDVT